MKEKKNHEAKISGSFGKDKLGEMVYVYTF